MTLFGWKSSNIVEHQKAFTSIFVWSAAVCTMNPVVCKYTPVKDATTCYDGYQPTLDNISKARER